MAKRPTTKPARLAVLDPPIGKRIRILVSSNSETRGLLWFRLTRDASLYFGPYYRSANDSAYKLVYGGRGRRTISLNDLTTVTDPAEVARTRTSVHPSGAISMSGRRFYREPMRHLVEQEEICTVLFQHPDFFPVVTTRPSDTADIHLLDAFDERFPLQAVLYIAPLGRPNIAVLKDAPYQSNLFFRYSGFQSASDRMVQLCIYQSRNKEWPRATYLIIPSGRRRFRAKLRRFIARLTTRWSRPGQLR